MSQSIYLHPVTLVSGPQAVEGGAVRLGGSMAYAREFALVIREGGVVAVTAGELFVDAIGHAAQRGDIQTVVRQLAVGQRRLGGFQGCQPQIHTGNQQAVLNGIEPLGTFGMAGTHLMLPTFGVRVIACFAHRSSGSGSFFPA